MSWLADELQTRAPSNGDLASEPGSIFVTFELVVLCCLVGQQLSRVVFPLGHPSWYGLRTTGQRICIARRCSCLRKRMGSAWQWAR